MPPKIFLYTTSIIRNIFCNKEENLDKEENLVKMIDINLFEFGCLPMY